MWLALYQLTRLTEDGNSFTSRLRFLTHAHDMLALHHAACRGANGKLLQTLLALLVTRIGKDKDEDEESPTSIRRQLNQCLQCCYGIKLGATPHRGDDLQMGKVELLQLYRFIVPLIESRAFRKLGPLKESFDRLMKLYPPVPEVMAARSALQDYLEGRADTLPQAVPSTIDEYGPCDASGRASDFANFIFIAEFHKNLYWHASLAGAVTDEILQVWMKKL